MTPLQVCLFKHFITTKGMESMFISLYRKYHLKKNPLLIEDFFRKVDPNEVCMTAFYFVINRQYGYDYWKKMQEKFDKYLKENESTYISEDKEWQSLKGIYRQLCLNWDAHKYWAYEKKRDAAKRLGFMLPEDKERVIKESEQENDDFSNVPEYADANRIDDVVFEGDDEKNEHVDDFDDFNIIDLKPRSHNSTKLKEDEISLNLRNKKSCITFNQFTSKEIQSRGGYEYAAIATANINDKNVVLLILNDVKGVPMLDGKGGKKGQDSNACINSKVLCARVEALLNITDDYTILKIHEHKRNDNYVAYIVSLK